MNRLVWEDGLSTKNELIDNQLKRLVALSQCWLDACTEDSPRISQVGDLLSALAYHFATQETLMRTMGVPATQINHHKASHRRLLARFRDALSAPYCGDRHQELASVMAALIDHIRWVDKQAQPPSLTPADFQYRAGSIAS